MAHYKLLNKRDDHEASQLAGEPKGEEQLKSALVVDDDPSIVLMVQLMLERLGFKVDLARNGREAQCLVDDERFYDLVVTDLSMPYVDGFELAEWVRKFTKKTRVVIISGCLTDGDIDRFIKSGLVDRWIAKPFGFRELTDVLGEIGLVSTLSRSV